MICLLSFALLGFFSKKRLKKTELQNFNYKSLDLARLDACLPG